MKCPWAIRVLAVALNSFVLSLPGGAPESISNLTSTSSVSLKAHISPHARPLVKKTGKAASFDLWLAGQCLALDSLPCVRVYSGTQASLSPPTSAEQVEYVVLGRSLDDFGPHFTREISAESPQKLVVCDREGKAVFDERTGGMFFLPTPKLIQATMRRGTELLSGGFEGLILWLPQFPLTDETLLQIASLQSDAPIVSAFHYDEILSSPLSTLDAFDQSLIAIDRIVAGIRDIQIHKAAQEGSIWLASYSWPALVENGLIAPLLSLPRGMAADGLVTVILPPSSEKVNLTLKELNVSNFEWTTFQAATSAAAAERLDCPLVLTFPYEFLSTTQTIDLAVAAHLVSPKRSKLLLGWDSQLYESDAEVTAKTAKSGISACPSMKAIVANVMASEKASRTRWDSGSRGVAIGISDTAQLGGSPDKTLAEILGLWLPCVRTGLPARFVAFDALADSRIAKGIDILLTSLKCQAPRNEELVALSDWIKGGGTLVLFAEQTQAPASWVKDSVSVLTGNNYTSAPAVIRLFHFLGLPGSVVEGAYRVGDGWLFYYPKSVAALPVYEQERSLLEILQYVAQTTRKNFVLRAQCAVFCGSIVAGFVATHGVQTSYQLRGSYVDLSTNGLEIVRDPVYERGDRFFLKSLQESARYPQVGLVAANVPVAIEQIRAAVRFCLPPVVSECSPTKRMIWIRRPPFPFRVEDTATGQCLEYNVPAGTRVLSPSLCPETTSVQIVTVP